MTELQELMRQNVAEPPHDDLDLARVLDAGRHRARARGVRVAGAASAVVAIGLVAAVLAPRASTGAGPSGAPDQADHSGNTGTIDSPPPAPDARTLHLSDATDAVEGRDYRVLASYTDHNLDRDNGQYFDGVTDDGKILFRDGPRLGQLYPRFALMDPGTGAKDWLPDPQVGQHDLWTVELGTRQLVLTSLAGDGASGALLAHVYDRSTREWHTVSWPGLPDVEGAPAVLGPDDRLYVSVPAVQGQPPRGGWPTVPGGEADDSGAAGDTYSLWSVSLHDPSDVRNEQMSVGSVAFTPTTMVWTDRTNGAPGLVHVRTLATGEEHTFDPRIGARCNLLSLSASETRVVMSEFCGDYAGGTTRDDRVQVMDTNGDQVVTIQDSGIGGAIDTIGGASDIVGITSTLHSSPGEYLYDLATDRFLRISRGTVRWALGGPAPAGEFLWNTPVNDGHGATQWLGQLLP